MVKAAANNRHNYPGNIECRESFMNFKESVIFAIKRAHREKKELVVGREQGKWHILDMADPKSDMLSPSIIVTGAGIKYPDHEDLYAALVAEGA